MRHRDEVLAVGRADGNLERALALPRQRGKARIGAGVRLAEIAEHAELRKLFPALTTAAGLIGGPQIRNMGTLGGNLCQRNRCWYFRDEHVPCLLKGGDKCYALDGENRYHAVFAKGHPCVIVHPSTLAPVLIALGASAVVQGPKGKRTIEMGEFFQAPKSGGREHVLAPNEMVLSVKVPAAGLKNASYEVRHKQSYDWPLVQAAVAFKLDGGKAKDVRLTFRLTDSPSCLVADEGDMSGYLQRMLKAAGQQAPQMQPILEVNPEHPLVKALRTDSADFGDWCNLLFDQALLAEGGALEDPASFVKRTNALLMGRAG